MRKEPKQRIVIALNPHPNRPVQIRQNNPPQWPASGGYPPQMPGFTEGPPAPYLPEGQFSPYFANQPAAEAPSKSGSGLLGNFNIGQIKQVIDRMGGIEGVLSTVTKVQKVMQSVQQIAPMLKLLIPKSAAKTAADEEEDWEYRPRRRRKSGYRPRSGGNAGRYRTGKKRTQTGQRRRSYGSQRRPYAGQRTTAAGRHRYRSDRRRRTGNRY